MNTVTTRPLTDTIGAIPYRMALAGGWIDQPFVSRLDPAPPGSMVVVGLEPTCWFMERAGFATGTRDVALKLWNRRLPARDPAELVRQLYAEENRGKSDPSGSQDMIGLVYPGVSRLDYDFAHEGGIFPKQIESNNDPSLARWLEAVNVKQALISSGEGWLDADPEIRRLQPDIYAVNEDGDKGGKRQYLVLKRAPAPGLPHRSSTNLRGF